MVLKITNLHVAFLLLMGCCPYPLSWVGGDTPLAHLSLGSRPSSPQERISAIEKCCTLGLGPRPRTRPHIIFSPTTPNYTTCKPLRARAHTHIHTHTHKHVPTFAHTLTHINTHVHPHSLLQKGWSVDEGSQTRHACPAPQAIYGVHHLQPLAHHHDADLLQMLLRHT